MPPTSQPAAIELAHVNRRFLTPNGRSLTALRDFSMTVAAGEFAAIVGPTGCGSLRALQGRAAAKSG
jgi:NitT/TauT family transport system ATP-binding protein